MAFSTIGYLSLNPLNEIEFKKYFKIYFSSWLNTLNFETYKNNFAKNLRLYSEEKELEINYDNNDYYGQHIKLKTDFVKWEIKTIQGLLNWFDLVYKFYNHNEYDKGSLCENMTIEKQEFIINFKNLNDYRLKQDAFYSDYIENFRLINYLQWFDCIYLDILKTKNYLTDKLKTNGVELPTKKSKNKKLHDAIKNLVSIKIKELETYVKVRYFIEENQVTKVSFESHKIANDLNSENYNLNFQLSYLKTLKNEIISNDIKIIEYRPNEDYNGTQDFINWIDKQLTKIELNNLVETPTKYPFYCKIGALFAQGFITKKEKGTHFDFFYMSDCFSDISKLSKYIQTDILKTNKSVRQYVNDTLQETGGKNFYTSKTKMDNILSYCKEKNINFVQEFQTKYNLLNNLH